MCVLVISVLAVLTAAAAVAAAGYSNEWDNDGSRNLRRMAGISSSHGWPRTARAHLLACTRQHFLGHGTTGLSRVLSLTRQVCVHRRLAGHHLCEKQNAGV
jgi:hypothetical protein